MMALPRLMQYPQVEFTTVILRLLASTVLLKRQTTEGTDLYTGAFGIYTIFTYPWFMSQHEGHGMHTLHGSL